MAKKTASPGLEQNLESLETLVEQMESGDMTLEESLKAFEQGIQLTRACQTALQAAEQKVRILMADSEDAEDFEADSSDD